MCPVAAPACPVCAPEAAARESGWPTESVSGLSGRLRLDACRFTVASRRWALGSAGDRRAGAYGRWDRRREGDQQYHSNQEVVDLIISRLAGGALLHWGLQPEVGMAPSLKHPRPANPSVHVTVRPVRRWRNWGSHKYPQRQAFARWEPEEFTVQVNAEPVSRRRWLPVG